MAGNIRKNISILQSDRCSTLRPPATYSYLNGGVLQCCYPKTMAFNTMDEWTEWLRMIWGSPILGHQIMKIQASGQIRFAARALERLQLPDARQKGRAKAVEGSGMMMILLRGWRFSTPKVLGSVCFQVCVFFLFCWRFWDIELCMDALSIQKPSVFCKTPKVVLGLTYFFCPYVAWWSRMTLYGFRQQKKQPWHPPTCSNRARLRLNHS